MNKIRIILFVTFIESAATTCVERGIYFLTKNSSALNFSDVLNLWLALFFGVSYVLGALASHPLSKWASEKKILLGCLYGQIAFHLFLALGYRHGEVIFAGACIIGFLNGLKWPLLESFVSAGQSPKQAATTLGYFNMCWAGAIPVTLIIAGPMIGSNYPALLFLAPIAINVLSLFLCRPIDGRPAFLHEDHPHRPPAQAMPILRSLMVASRWMLLCSYAAMWVLAALLPEIFSRLGTNVQSASGLSGLLDLVRFFAFVLLQFHTGWHYRVRFILLATACLPIGFFMTLFGPNLATVLAGEIIFGLSSGLIYYSALYYAIILKNASVEASGGHEALIGVGFTLGPAAGLIGAAMSGVLGSSVWGMLIGIGPVFAICSVGGVLPALAAWRKKKSLDPNITSSIDIR